MDIRKIYTNAFNLTSQQIIMINWFFVLVSKFFIIDKKEIGE
jgi:hypothetical protein